MDGRDCGTETLAYSITLAYDCGLLQHPGDLRSESLTHPANTNGNLF